MTAPHLSFLKRKRVVHRALALLAFVILPSSRANAETPISATFCRFPSMLSALTNVAETKGYFRDAGLDVKLINVTNGKACQDELIAGNTEFISVANGPFTYVASDTLPLKAIAVLQDGAGVSIYTRTDVGIEKLDDLKGKHLAYLPGTISAFFTFKVLEKLGIGKQDLRLSAMQLQAMPSALLGKQVDAIATWEPWGTIALNQLGDKARKLPGRDIYQYQSFLVTSDTVLKEKPEAAKRMLVALMKAEDLFRDHKQEAFSILAKHPQFEPKSLNATWDDFTHHIHLGPRSITLLEDNFSMMVKYDLNSAEKVRPNFRKLFDDRPLRAVAAERVEAGF